MIHRACALVLAFLPLTVDSAASYDPVVSCTSIIASASDSESFQACATSEQYSPSPAMFENSTGTYTMYMGGWSHYFDIYDSSAEGLNPDEGGFPGEADLHMEVHVERDDNNICAVHVKTTGIARTCDSCLYCEGTSASYSADCTNLQNGRMVECESAENEVFFPLTNEALSLQSTPTTTCTFQRADDLMSWFDHNRIAKSKGCNLASITSEEEQTQVEALYAGDSIGKHIWIGGMKVEGTSEWKWSDGSAFEYTNWNVGEPTNQVEETRVHLMYPNYPQSNMKWNNRTPNDIRMALYKCCE